MNHNCPHTQNVSGRRSNLLRFAGPLEAVLVEEALGGEAVEARQEVHQRNVVRGGDPGELYSGRLRLQVVNAFLQVTTCIYKLQLVFTNYKL